MYILGLLKNSTSIFVAAIIRLISAVQRTLLRRSKLFRTSITLKVWGRTAPKSRQEKQMINKPRDNFLFLWSGQAPKAQRFMRVNFVRTLKALIYNNKLLLIIKEKRNNKLKTYNRNCGSYGWYINLYSCTKFSYTEKSSLNSRIYLPDPLKK